MRYRHNPEQVGITKAHNIFKLHADNGRVQHNTVKKYSDIPNNIVNIVFKVPNIMS